MIHRVLILAVAALTVASGGHAFGKQPTSAPTSQPSNKTWLRNVRVTVLFYNPDGSIRVIDPFVSDLK